VDAEAALPHDELAGREVDGAGRLEADCRVRSARRDVAERDRLSAHDANTVGERRELAQLLEHEPGPGRLEREELYLLLRLPRHGSAVEEGAPAAHGRPLLVGAEVVDEAEDHVVHRRSLRDCDGEREVRNRALGVLGPVDRVDDHGVAPVAVNADLLRDDAHVGPVEVGEHGPLGRLVEGCRDVAALPLPDWPLALGARRHRAQYVLHVGDGRTAQLQPLPLDVRAHRGRSRRPEVSFG